MRSTYRIATQYIENPLGIYIDASSACLDLQVGVGVQGVVLEDVAGLDGLHQAQVVGVDDSGGQTLHHAHCNQSGVHDGTDMLGIR